MESKCWKLYLTLENELLLHDFDMIDNFPVDERHYYYENGNDIFVNWAHVILAYPFACEDPKCNRGFIVFDAKRKRDQERIKKRAEELVKLRGHNG